MKAGAEGHGFGVYRYHDVTVRAERRKDGTPFVCLDRLYSFDESVSVEDTRDYFYIEAMEDGATVTCENFKASYGLSSSLDRVTWTALTGETVATGLSAGQKVHLIGDTDTLGNKNSATAGVRLQLRQGVQDRPERSSRCTATCSGQRS